MAEAMRRDDLSLYEISSEIMLDNLRNGRPMVSKVRNHYGISGNVWQGANYDHLEQIAIQRGYTDGRWGGQRALKNMGHWIKKDEQSIQLENKRRHRLQPKINPTTGEIERDRVGNPVMEPIQLRQAELYLFPVFNAEQLQNVPPMEYMPHKMEPMARAMEILYQSGIAIVHDQQQESHYNPLLREIHMVAPEKFASKREYVEAGLYALIEAMSYEERVRDSNQANDEYHVRDQMAYHKAYIRLCREIGLEIDPNLNVEKTQMFIEALEENPYIFKDSSELAQSIVNAISEREHNRHPELARTDYTEQSAMRFASPRLEVQNFRIFQNLLSEADKGSEDIVRFSHGDRELYTFAKNIGVYDRPQTSPEPGETFPIKYRAMAYDRMGSEYEVISTQYYVQQADGNSIVDPTPPSHEITRTNREVSFPANWTGKLVMKNVSLDRQTNEFVHESGLDENAEYYGVSAETTNGTLIALKVFADADSAAHWADTYEAEYARQTRTMEKSIDGVTFFEVGGASRSTLRQMGLEFYQQMRAYGTKDESVLAACEKAFGPPIDVEKRLEELKEQQAARQQGKGLRCFDVPKHKAKLAYDCGLAHSARYDQWYLRGNADPAKALKYFTEVEPKGITKTEPSPDKPITLFVLPQDRTTVEAKGATYNEDEGVWQAPAGSDIREFQNFLPENNLDHDNSLLTPAAEAKIKLESIGFHLDALPQPNGKPVTTEQGSYVLNPDGTLFAKSADKQEVYHAPKGYILTDEHKQSLREQAASVISGEAAKLEALLTDNAKKLSESLSGMPEPSKQNKAMKTLDIPPLPGLIANGSTLIVPRYDAYGEIRSAEYVKGDGSQSTAADTQSVGTAAVIGNQGEEKVAIIGTKIEEMAAIAATTGFCVKAAIEEQNLIPVAVAEKNAHPDKRIIVVGTDVSPEVAKEAAKLCDGVVLKPLGTDHSTFREAAQAGLEGEEIVDKTVKRCVERERDKAVTRDIRPTNRARETPHHEIGSR